MSTDLLTLTQWLSPAFPVGAFSYSHGLEQVIDRGDLRDPEALTHWVTDLLEHGGARSDIILLAAAYHADPQDISTIDAICCAFAASAGRLTETRDQGAAFSRTVDAVWGTDLGAMTYPVAVGRAARIKTLPIAATSEIYLHAFIANLVSAAVRLVPLGQTDGQRILAAVAPLIMRVAAEARETPLEEISSACFASDIAAMHHETQYSKVFRT